MKVLRLIYSDRSFSIFSTETLCNNKKKKSTPTTDSFEEKWLKGVKKVTYFQL